MRSTLPDLELFAVVARHRNFRKAAVESGVSASLVSQVIRKLEDQLGVQLLRRTTRSVALTDAGEELLESLEPGLRLIHEAVDRVNAHRGSPIGSLRINAPAPVAQFLLAPLAAKFARLHPDVSIELVAEAAFQDIVAGGFDAGVRFGNQVPQDMVAVRIGSAQKYAVVGAPAYFRRKPAPRTPKEVAAHDCIVRRFPSGSIQHWEYLRRPALKHAPAGRIVVNDAQTAVTAAVAGGGLTFQHEKYVEREIAAGKLVRVLEAWAPGISPPYLYYSRQRHVPAPLRAFIELARAQAD